VSANADFEPGTDIEYNPETSPHEPPHQLKLKVRAYIKEMAGKIEHTYVVTGPYSDLYFGPTKLAPYIGTFDVVEKKAVLCGTGNEKVSFTSMADVGKLAVAAMLAPEASRNATLIVNSFTCTPAEIADEYQKQTGEKWDVSTTSLAKLKELEKEAYEKKHPAATVFTLRRIWTEGGTLYDYRDNEKLGDVQLETLEEQVTKNIEDQTGTKPWTSPILGLSST
jgi:nucleoside-diphosphate-sugar epimerase